MNVIEVPASLDSRSVDDFLDAVAAAPEGKLLLDAKHVRWVAPTGMIALLGCASVAKQRGSSVVLRMPEQPEVSGYLARMGFFAEAERLMELDQRPPHRDGGESDVLLEITPVSTHSDVHRVVDRVQTRAGAILSRTLGYPPTA